jgi:hypothetical protein
VVDLRHGADPESFRADDRDCEYSLYSDAKTRQVGHGKAPTWSPALRQLDQLLFGRKVVQSVGLFDRVPQRQIAGELTGDLKDGAWMAELPPA